jgi:hypothetical protein
LESSTLLVSDTKDSEVMVRVVLLLKIIELLILEFSSGLVWIDLSIYWFALDLMDCFSDGNRASLSLNCLFLQALEVGLHVERPEAVNKNNQSDD